MDKATDYFGVEIEVGDIVAYATSSSSNVQMNHGLVLSVEPYVRRYGATEKSFKISIRKLGESGYGSPMRKIEATRAITVHEIGRCINLSKFKDQESGNISSA